MGNEGTKISKNFIHFIYTRLHNKPFLKFGRQAMINTIDLTASRARLGCAAGVRAPEVGAGRAAGRAGGVDAAAVRRAEGRAQEPERLAGGQPGRHQLRQVPVAHLRQWRLPAEEERGCGGGSGGTGALFDALG